MTTRKYYLLSGGVIVLLALTVRFLTWQDNRRDIWKVQTSVTEGYKDSARQLLAGDFKTFVSDINHFGHPPGYPILLAAIFKIAGNSNTAIHLVQILADVIAVILLFLIALELFPAGVALIAALLAAISPQFAYFSVVLLPDSLIVAPILLAVYVVVRARNNPQLFKFVIAGALIGLSCWFRANSLLLPFLLAATASLLVERGKRLRASSAVLAGALLLIAPITIKNAVVYQRFIPLSLGAGQTLVEGIADYDESGRFNIPNTDLGLMQQEAKWYGNPEYAQLLFGRDGIERDRMRLARGFAVIRSHPFWFTGVVIRRGLDSTRLDPVPVLARESPVSQDFASSDSVPVWTNTPRELATRGTAAKRATLTVVDEQWLRINCDLTDYETQHSSEVINVLPKNDYAFRLPIKLTDGRVQVKVTNAGEDEVLAAVGIDPVEGVSAEDQPVRDLTIPFVSANESKARLVIANFASERPAVVLLGPAKLLELGPSSQQWLRNVRIPIGFVQRVFTTAWILPLVVFGLVLLIRRREWQTLVIILTVPAYYLIVQPILHTERRYVYIIHFFLLIPVALTLWTLFNLALSAIRVRKTSV